MPIITATIGGQKVWLNKLWYCGYSDQNNLIALLGLTIHTNKLNRSMRYKGKLEKLL